MKKAVLIVTITLFFAILSYWAVSYMVPPVPQNTGFIDKVKAQIRKLKFEARADGKLVTKNSNYLIVSVDSKNYTIYLNSTTALRPKYWGKVDLNDFNLGDELNIIGSFRNKNNNEINATLIRDRSNEMRWGVFLGDVTSKDKNKIVFNNKTRGDLTAFVEDDTNYVGQNGGKIRLDNIKIGDRIRVKGIFDNKTKKITNIDEVKDFALN